MKEKKNVIFNKFPLFYTNIAVSFYILIIQLTLALNFPPAAGHLLGLLFFICSQSIYGLMELIDHLCHVFYLPCKLL